MRLYATRTSPYARKVRIALLEKNIPCVLEWVDLRAADHGALEHNPLGKIPVLVRNDGSAVYDSAVIIQYLEILRTVVPARRHHLASRSGRRRALSGSVWRHRYKSADRDRATDSLRPPVRPPGNAHRPALSPADKGHRAARYPAIPILAGDAPSEN